MALGSSPFRYKHPAYFADTASAAWVSPGSNGNAGAAGNYVYDLTVDLTGLDPASVTVTGVMGTDNDGAIWVNGESPAATTGFSAFGSPTGFTIDSGWVAGENTIHVRANNAGDPTAFYVRFDSSSAVEAVGPAVPVSSLTIWSTIILTLVIAGFGVMILRR